MSQRSKTLFTQPPEQRNQPNSMKHSLSEPFLVEPPQKLCDSNENFDIDFENRPNSLKSEVHANNNNRKVFKQRRISAPHNIRLNMAPRCAINKNKIDPEQYWKQKLIEENCTFSPTISPKSKQLMQNDKYHKKRMSLGQKSHIKAWREEKISQKFSEIGMTFSPLVFCCNFN